MLSPPPQTSPSTASECARVGTCDANYQSTPKLLSPQSPYLSEEGWAIYDGPATFAAAGLALDNNRGLEFKQGSRRDPDAARGPGNSVVTYPITMLMRQADRKATAASTIGKPLLRGAGATFSTRSPHSQTSPVAVATNPGDAGYGPAYAQAPGLHSDQLKNAAVAKLNEVLFGPRSPPSSPLRQPVPHAGREPRDGVA
jgi:hypothetical protein